MHSVNSKESDKSVKYQLRSIKRSMSVSSWHCIGICVSYTRDSRFEYHFFTNPIDSTEFIWKNSNAPVTSILSDAFFKGLCFYFKIFIVVLLHIDQYPNQ